MPIENAVDRRPDHKKALLELITRRSFKYADEPVFTLVSGRTSRFYIDCKMTTLYSKGLLLTGMVVYDHIAGLRLDGIGGLTLGADPIAAAAALVAGQQGEDLTAFVVRKEPKKHGLKKWIEGDIGTGDRVAIIDDVITTGGSTIKAIDRALEAGLDVVTVIVLVDREEGGRENIEKERGFAVEPIFTRTELLAEHRRLE